MEGSFWQKDSLICNILFELWLIMIFSPLERKLAKWTSVQCGDKFGNEGKLKGHVISRYFVKWKEVAIL